MCRFCVKTPYPQRERLCCESGAYLLNFDGCSICKEGIKSLDSLKITAKLEEEDEENREIISFDHTCARCGHQIAKHTHEFWLEDGYQEYRMDCLLCGIGEDSISILPNDPRKI